jgi:hypothetical protein
MNHIIYLAILATISLSACNKVKNKTQELADKTEQKVKDTSKDLLDRVSPRFDAYTPDTKYNKERFKDFLQVPLTADVKDIYCFADAIGIDADYQFAFHCDTATVSRIIRQHGLTLAQETTMDVSGLQNDFPWWDKNTIAQLSLYIHESENRYFKYFWYDSTKQQAYFFDFDM